MTICDPQNKTSSKHTAFNATAWVAPTAVLFCALDYCSSQLFSIHLHIRGEETGGNSEKPKLIKVIAVTTLSDGRFLLAFLLFEVGRQQDFSDPQLWLLLQGWFFFLRAKGNLKEIGSLIEVKRGEGQFSLQHVFGYTLTRVPWRGFGS